MRINRGEFRARPLRVHALLHDVPLEDAWAVLLEDGGAGRTIQDLRAVMLDGLAAAPPVVQGLFWLRGRMGALFGWDRRVWNAESYADRLSAADRARSLAAPGTPDGRFSLLYRFDDEQLSELRNATVHAFVSLSLRPVPAGYLAYVGVFVQPVHRFTRLYMGAIAPFRRLVVYPAIMRKVQSAWAERYGGQSGRAGTARDILADAYRAFNERDIERALGTMHPEVDWPNGMEGGYLRGQAAVRDYWTRQWGLIDPRVEPQRFSTDDAGRTVVDVHQVVRDRAGRVLTDQTLQHIYVIQDGLIRRMEIRK